MCRQTAVMVSLNLLLPARILFSKFSLKFQSNPLSPLLKLSPVPTRECDDHIALKGKASVLGWWLDVLDRFSPLGRSLPFCYSTFFPLQPKVCLFVRAHQGCPSTPPCLPCTSVPALEALLRLWGIYNSHNSPEKT